MTTILRFVGLNVSTYYSLKKSKEHSKEKTRSGRKIPGYSFNQQGEVINDDTIKTMLLELIEGDGYPYGYRKLTVELQEEQNLIINHKKVYRLCRELGILRPQRVLKPYRPGRIGHKRKATGPNEHWEIDLKYGYIKGIRQFFYQVSIIDIFDRTIVESHIGLSAKAKDAARIVQIAVEKRGVKPGQLVVRSDNGPQFRAKAFTEALHKLEIIHERIPVNSPNLNAYIESFHSILEDECYSRHEFETFQEAYEEVNNYLDYYNNRRRHGSIVPEGTTPYQAMASCSGSTVVTLLRKMGKGISGLKVIARGERRDEHPLGFKAINLDFIVQSGDIIDTPC